MAQLVVCCILRVPLITRCHISFLARVVRLVYILVRASLVNALLTLPLDVVVGAAVRVQWPLMMISLVLPSILAATWVVAAKLPARTLIRRCRHLVVESVAATVVVLPVLLVICILLRAVDPLSLRVGLPLVILVVTMRRAGVRAKGLLAYAAIVLRGRHGIVVGLLTGALLTTTADLASAFLFLSTGITPRREIILMICVVEFAGLLVAASASLPTVVVAACIGAPSHITINSRVRQLWLTHALLLLSLVWNTAALARGVGLLAR